MAESSGPSPTISGDSIKVIAETVGIANLKGEVAEALAADVEYRLRDLVQEALKFMKHGRRETLSTDDINFALRLRSAEPLYGFASGEAPRFCRATGAADVYAARLTLTLTLYLTLTLTLTLTRSTTSTTPSRTWRTSWPSRCPRCRSSPPSAPTGSPCTARSPPCRKTRARMR